MRKKIVPVLLLTAIFVSKVFAVGISDIPTIAGVSLLLRQDAEDFADFASKLQLLNDAGFLLSVAGSTQTVTLNNAQKSGLIAQYQNLKQKMQDDFALLP